VSRWLTHKKSSKTTRFQNVNVFLQTDLYFLLVFLRSYGEAF
jgi:hypothetical protein